MSRFLNVLIRSRSFVNRRLSLEQRQFWKLKLKLAGVPRFQPGKVRLFGKTVAFVDAASFLAMYANIFTMDSYWFPSSSEFPLILDCGANIGLSLIKFKQLYPKSRIIAFEADQNIADVLEKNIKLNDLYGVEVVRAAVWTKSGRIPFNSDGADAGSVVNQSEESGVFVPSVRLQDYLHQAVDLLKMDIEGAESNVLEDCGEALRNVRCIVCEYHSFVNRAQDLYKITALFHRLGFRYYIWPEQQRVNPFRYLSPYKNIDQMFVIHALRPADLRYSADLGSIS